MAVSASDFHSTFPVEASELASRLSLVEGQQIHCAEDSGCGDEGFRYDASMGCDVLVRDCVSWMDFDVLMGSGVGSYYVSLIGCGALMGCDVGSCCGCDAVKGYGALTLIYPLFHRPWEGAVLPKRL